VDRTPWAMRIKCLERMKVTIQREARLKLVHVLALSEEAQINLATEFFAAGLTAQLTAVLAGEHVRVLEAQYPADWKEAVKERFLPRFLRKLWPIRYVKLGWDVRVVYPEISLPDEPHTILDAVPVREFSVANLSEGIYGR